MAILILAALDSDDWQHTFLVLNLTVIVFINIFAAVFQVNNSDATTAPSY